jgi:hypothetical protein
VASNKPAIVRALHALYLAGLQLHRDSPGGHTIQTSSVKATASARPSTRHPVVRALRATLWLAGSLVGSIVVGLGLLAAYGAWNLKHNAYDFPDRDLPRHLAGRWDWSTRAHPCGDSAHVIAFSPDRKTMTIAMPPRLSDTGWTATYDISRVTPSSLRGAIRGEKRLTDDSVPVVWDLVMFGADEYHWQRTDWPSWHFTAGVVRCGPQARDST